MATTKPNYFTLDRLLPAFVPSCYIFRRGRAGFLQHVENYSDALETGLNQRFMSQKNLFFLFLF